MTAPLPMLTFTNGAHKEEVQLMPALPGTEVPSQITNYNLCVLFRLGSSRVLKSGEVILPTEDGKFPDLTVAHAGQSFVVEGEALKMPPEPAKAKERLNKANDARTRKLKELSAQQKDAHPVWSTSEACQKAAADKAAAEKAFAETAAEKAAAEKAAAEKAAAEKAAADKAAAEKAAAEKAAAEKAAAQKAAADKAAAEKSAAEKAAAEKASAEKAAAEKAAAEKASAQKAAAEKAAAQKAAAEKASAQKAATEKAAAQKAATEKALAEGFAEKGVPRPSNPPVGGTPVLRERDTKSVVEYVTRPNGVRYPPEPVATKRPQPTPPPTAPKKTVPSAAGTSVQHHPVMVDGDRMVAERLQRKHESQMSDEALARMLLEEDRRAREEEDAMMARLLAEGGDSPLRGSSDHQLARLLAQEERQSRMSDEEYARQLQEQFRREGR